MAGALLLDECDAELTGVQEVEAGRLYLRQCQALLTVWDSAPDDTTVGQHPQVLAEVASLLHLHPTSVGGRLGVALSLRAHPALAALLRDGRLGIAHTLTAVEELDALEDPDLAGRVLHEVLLSAGRLGWDGTPARLRGALRRTAVRLDPAAADRRRQQELDRRTGIRLRPLPDGLASWTATGASTQLIATDRLLDVLSQPAGPDDTRGRGQRQLDALLAALVARAGNAVDLELQIGIPVQVTDTSPVAGCTPEPLAIALDLTPDLLALLAGTATGGSSVTEPCPQELVQAEPVTSEPVECELVEPELTELEMSECDELQPRADDAVVADAEPQTIASVQPKPVEPVDDDIPPRPAQGPPRRLGRRQGVAELVDHGPVGPALLAELLHDPDGLPVGIRRIQLRRICIDPTGQAVAIDDRAVPLARLLPGRTVQPDHAQVLRRLIKTLPTPPPATDAYQPTTAQTRLLRARDSCCTFPGCARRSRRCELDHRDPYRDGGPTSVSNFHPLCKHHHRLKHDGWTCTRTPDGTTTWTSPRGQHLTGC